MLDCRQCQGIEEFFDQREAQRDLARYRKHGPHKTTQMLIDAMVVCGVEWRAVRCWILGEGSARYSTNSLRPGSGVPPALMPRRHMFRQQLRRPAPGALRPYRAPPRRLRRHRTRHRAGRYRYTGQGHLLLPRRGEPGGPVLETRRQNLWPGIPPLQLGRQDFDAPL